MIWTILRAKELLMANGVVVQIAVLSVFAIVLVGLLITLMRRKDYREPSRKVPQPRTVIANSAMMPPRPMQSAASQKPAEVEQQAPRPMAIEAASSIAQPNEQPNKSDANVPPNSEVTKPQVVVQAQLLTNQEDHNQRILAGISENIRKSVIKPVPTYSPLHYPETPRDTEYVRVKKKIITPHGQVRFSILKDSISTNMLAVFRRACMEWKTPHDLISFLPPYLEPEAEILNNQLLLVGTPGHDEKLAIPIRSFDLDSKLRDCFNFVTDDRTATNTPAVLRMSDSDDEFEVVSRGVITQPVFLSSVGRGPTEVNRLLVEKSFAIGSGTAIST
jgi:hypothetical protein